MYVCIWNGMQKEKGLIYDKEEKGGRKEGKEERLEGTRIR
jgi:hypothetical protein